MLRKTGMGSCMVPPTMAGKRPSWESRDGDGQVLQAELGGEGQPGQGSCWCCRRGSVTRQGGELAFSSHSWILCWEVSWQGGAPTGKLEGSGGAPHGCGGWGGIWGYRTSSKGCWFKLLGGLGGGGG